MIFENLSNLKGVPLDFLACQSTDYDRFSSKEYWAGSKAELIDFRIGQERPKLVLTADSIYKLYEHPKILSTSLGDNRFMSIESVNFKNTEEDINKLAPYSFCFYFNLTVQRIIALTKSYFFEDTNVDLEWLQGFLVEGNKKKVLIYADCEYGSKAIIKICVNEEKIADILERHQFKEHIL